MFHHQEKDVDHLHFITTEIKYCSQTAVILGINFIITNTRLLIHKNNFLCIRKCANFQDETHKF